MSSLPRSLAIAALALCAVPPATASAGFFAGTTVDGPSADIVRVGGVDLARDGSGAVVYVRKVSGIDHVFTARLVSGVWQTPERLDPALLLPSAEPVIGVANRGQAVVAFTNNGQLYVIVRRAKDSTWPAPVAIGPAGAATPSIDLSVNGVGYLVWSAGGDVRAATLDRTARSFRALAAPLDIVAAADAGSGLGRPRVAAGADGTGLAAWGEDGHVYARRLLHATLSDVPQELGVADLGGHAGGVADSPVVDMLDDASFAWVVFRQAFDGGTTTRVLARRLVGSAYDPPQDVGAGAFGGEGATSPALDVAGADGIAITASETTGSFTPFAALEYLGVLRAPFVLSEANPAPSLPAVATGETSQSVAVWFDDVAGLPAEVHGRSYKFGKQVDVEVALSDPALGPVDNAAGLLAASDKYGDTVIPFVQGAGAARRLVAATWDRPPVNLIATTTTAWRTPRPLGWERVREVWGGLIYTVVVDGTAVGSTPATSLPIEGLVADGTHRWTLIVTDSRGQRSMTPPRTLRIDSTGPRLRLAVTGKRRAGRALRLVVRATDAGSGLRSVKIDFGDGSTPSFGLVHRHAYARGRYRVRVTGRDRLGNRRVIRRRVNVR